MDFILILLSYVILLAPNLAAATTINAYQSFTPDKSKELICFYREPEGIFVDVRKEIHTLCLQSSSVDLAQISTTIEYLIRHNPITTDPRKNII